MQGAGFLSARAVNLACLLLFVGAPGFLWTVPSSDHGLLRSLFPRMFGGVNPVGGAQALAEEAGRTTART